MRTRKLNNKDFGDGPIIYWMSRDQRINDNWALLYSQQLAIERKVDLVVVFSLVPVFLGANKRQFDFMLKDLREVDRRLADLNIEFHAGLGDPGKVLFDFSKTLEAGALVCDFSPLRIKKSWINGLRKKLSVPFFEVDAHNIVPVWIASEKQEFSARTIRPKIMGLLSVFLEGFPALKEQKKGSRGSYIDWDDLLKKLNLPDDVRPVDWIKPGEKAAKGVLKEFIKLRLSEYHLDRNNATKKGVSNLSPYLHFGMISAQRVALEVVSSKTSGKSKEAFIEELIVRRELSDNFCFYNPDYDSFKGFPDWAKRTLNDHRHDIRDYVYSLQDFEKSKTHDSLWNAAQLEMVSRGKMHGYMRMYWAKKILEWTKSPEEALEIAIYLNDKYELDGRDPNGYVGCAWSIGGLHDRPWGERAVFGKVRYMTEAACKRKFDIKKYIALFS